MSFSEPIASDSHGEKAVEVQSVYVYEAPVRLWHWVNAFAILALAITGYLIASPLPSFTGPLLVGASVGATLLTVTTVVAFADVVPSFARTRTVNGPLLRGP